MKKLNRIALLVIAAALVFVKPVLAADDYDAFYNTQNNIIFYDNPNAPSCAVTGGSTTFPPTSTKIDASTLQRIKNLQSVYQQASEQTKVPWQVYAAIDYREDNNDEKKSMLDGNPLGTEATDSKNKPMTKLESIIIGNGIMARHAKDNYGIDVTQPMDFDQLQKVFVGYNRGASYKNAGVSADASPYVMNQYDDAHHNMTYPNIPPTPPDDKGETLRGIVDKRFGAMTIYANIATLGTGSCVGAGVGAKVNYTGLYPDKDAGTLSDDLLCKPRASQPGFKLLKGPACDSFIAMNAAYKVIYGKDMPLSGGYRSAAEQIACGGTKEAPKAGSKCIAYDPKNDPPEHLWGTAIDFSGPLADKRTGEHQWLVTNGPQFGWFWPHWAQAGLGGNARVEEDWHFAYYFVGHDPNRVDKNGNFLGDTLESFK